MADPLLPRPAPTSIAPVLSVLARAVIADTAGGAAGGTAPSTSPLLRALASLAPSGATPGGPAAQAPAWAQLLATLPADRPPLGESLAELARVLTEQLGREARPETRALAETLQRFAALEGLDGPGLRERLREVGQFLEARVAAEVAERPTGPRPQLDPATLLSLKAQLLRVQAAGPEAELGRAVERVLATLDGEQLHNVARAEHGEEPVHHLPVPDGDGWSSAWFQRGGGQGDDQGAAPGHATLTVGINLSQLGAVRADLALAPDLLRVRVAVSRPDVRVLVEQQLPQLLSDLERVGRPVAIGVELDTEERLAPPVPVVDGQLDVAG